MRLVKLTVAAEVYHCHYDELPPERQALLLELIAARIEMRRREKEASENK